MCLYYAVGQSIEMRTFEPAYHAVSVEILVALSLFQNTVFPKSHFSKDFLKCHRPPPPDKTEFTKYLVFTMSQDQSLKVSTPDSY